MCVYLYWLMAPQVRKCLGGQRAVDARKVELQVVGRSLMWMLGPEPGPSARLTNTLNC